MSNAPEDEDGRDGGGHPQVPATPPCAVGGDQLAAGTPGDVPAASTDQIETEMRLTDGRRNSLRQLTATLMVADPRSLQLGALAADQMRLTFPELADETIAVVLDIAVAMGITFTATTGCAHVQSFTRLLSSVVADLAHLELDAP